MYQLFVDNAFLLSPPEKCIHPRVHNGAANAKIETWKWPNATFHYTRVRRANTRDNTFNQGRKWFRRTNFDSYAATECAHGSRHRARVERVFSQIYPLSRGYYIHAAPECIRSSKIPSNIMNSPDRHSTKRDPWSTMSQWLSLCRGQRFIKNANIRSALAAGAKAKGVGG